MKQSRISCLAFVFVGVLALMTVGMLTLVASLSVSSPYTLEQQAVLSDNEQRRMNQQAPMFNTYGDISGREYFDKAALQAVASGARESHVTADLKVTYVDKSGVTVTAYDLQFAAYYVVDNPTSQRTLFDISFPFPANSPVLSEVSFKVDGSEPPSVTYSLQNIYWRAVLEPGQQRKIEVSYRAEGVGSFAYGVPASQRIRDFDVRVMVNGAQEINVPEGALQPTARTDEATQTTLTWQYKDIITNRSVNVDLPARQSLAFVQRVERMSEFFMGLAVAAPILTVLFLLCLWVAVWLEALPTAAENIILLGIGFFLFYPLFIVASGLLDLPLAYVVALLVGGALVLGYGMRVWGRPLAAIYLVPLLVVFYGLLTRGLTVQQPLDFGLMIIISGIVLVALFMWRFSLRKPKPRVESPARPAPVVTSSAPAPVPPAPEPIRRPASPQRFCVHCGHGIQAEFKFCPACGQGAQVTHRCSGCNLEYVPAESGLAFCPACGKKLEVRPH